MDARGKSRRKPGIEIDQDLKSYRGGLILLRLRQRMQPLALPYPLEARLESLQFWLTSTNLGWRLCSPRIVFDYRDLAKSRQFRSGPIDFAVAHSSHKISSRSSSVAQLHKYEFPHDAGIAQSRGLHAVQLFYRMRGNAVDRLTVTQRPSEF